MKNKKCALYSCCLHIWLTQKMRKIICFMNELNRKLQDMRENE